MCPNTPFFGDNMKNSNVDKIVSKYEDSKQKHLKRLIVNCVSLKKNWKAFSKFKDDIDIPEHMVTTMILSEDNLPEMTVFFKNIRDKDFDKVISIASTSGIKEISIFFDITVNDVKSLVAVNIDNNNQESLIIYPYEVDDGNTIWNHDKIEVIFDFENLPEDDYLKEVVYCLKEQRSFTSGKSEFNLLSYLEDIPLPKSIVNYYKKKAPKKILTSLGYPVIDNQYSSGGYLVTLTDSEKEEIEASQLISALLSDEFKESGLFQSINI